MSDMSDYNSAAAVNAGAQISSSLINTTGNVLNSTFNKRNTKELAKFQNEMAIENWNRVNEYNEKLQANYYNNQMQAARNAGLNPLAAFAGPNFAQTVGSIPQPTVTQFPVSSLDAGNLGNLALTNIAAKQGEATIDKTLSEIKGLDLNNAFLGDTLRSRINLTNEENTKWTEINSMIRSNPAFLEAYAKEKYLQNNLLDSDKALKDIMVELNKVNTEKSKAETSKVKQEERNLIEEQFLTRSKRYLTDTQRSTLMDQNFRDNSNNVSWLLNAIDSTYKDPKLTQEEKIQKCRVYNAALDNVSRQAEYKRELGKINAQAQSTLAIDDNKGRNTIENTRAFGEEMRETNREQVFNNLVEDAARIPLDKIRDEWIYKSQEERSNKEYDRRQDPMDYIDRQIQKKHDDQLKQIKNKRRFWDRFKYKGFDIID